MPLGAALSADAIYLRQPTMRYNPNYVVGMLEALGTSFTGERPHSTGQRIPATIRNGIAEGTTLAGLTL